MWGGRWAGLLQRLLGNLRKMLQPHLEAMREQLVCCACGVGAVGRGWWSGQVAPREDVQGGIAAGLNATNGPGSPEGAA